MVSSLSDLADRNFILGFLLPVIVAGLAALALFQDISLVAGIWTAVKNADEFAKLTVLILVFWTLAVLLLAFNTSLYRLLEGYIGPFAWISWFKTRQWKAFDKEQTAYATRRAEIVEDEKQQSEKKGPYAGIDAAAAQKLIELREKKRDKHVKDTATLRKTFPRERDQVLPTRLGNVIRAFEVYSYYVYGLDSIPGWLRLQGVIPDSYSKLIENARAEVDFFVNCCALFALIAAASLAFALWQAFPVLQDGTAPDISVWQHLSACALAAVASYISYDMAVLRAPEWGDLVRSAFDLYLPDLVKQLGYTLPDAAADRRGFWGALASVFVFGTPLNEKYLPKAAVPEPEPAPQTSITIIADKIDVTE